MPFVILALDKPGSASLRATLRPDHLDYLIARQDLLLAGGAVLDGNGKAIGGLIIVDIEDAQAAQGFADGDPFNTGGLTASVQVMPWRKSFFDGQRTTG